MNVAVLITLADDGKDGATACLEECQRQTEALVATGGYSFTIFLNDEGVDGYQKVWGKASGAGFDFYLWMDSDLRLEEGALASFFENSFFLRHKAVIAGTVSDLSGNLLFGGRSKHGRLLEPDPVIPVPCHLYDMTLTLVPEYAVRHLENPSDIFHPSLWDYGCGAKVAKAGIARVIAPGILARTGRKPTLPVWKNPEKSVLDRALSLFKACNREFIQVLHSIFR
ncbi:MAG TPA: hypothetical protein DDX40_02720 [Rikenellaceae bacterium]|nr:hypothetical protein [Rikenellaceae bacterium]